MPLLGGSVTVLYLGTTVSGVVTKIDDGGRGLLVVTEDGDTLTFALSRATGRFVDDGHLGARLVFVPDP
ncbi:MAG: hypothetical protein ACR2OB_14110 [Solirubrobacteraceae bacterium]